MQTQPIFHVLLENAVYLMVLCVAIWLTGKWTNREALASRLLIGAMFGATAITVMFTPFRVDDGIIFDGRIAEDFKLSTGTWVSVWALRVAVIAACGGAVSDVVIAGHDRDAIGLLVFTNGVPCPDAIRACLARHNAANPGSSTWIARALVLTEPPDVDAGEITYKGYLNQRRILERRVEDVARLFQDPVAAGVISL